MGIDKEATDIWKFGRSRPDLTMEETVAAAPPTDLTLEEIDRRQALSDERFERWLATQDVAAMVTAAKAKAKVRAT